MARTKLTTVEEQPVKSIPILAPIPKAKVNFKKTSGTPEEPRLAPKGVTGTRERKLMSEPVYKQGEGITKKTISQRSVILGPKKPTLAAQAQPQPQPLPRVPTPKTKGALVADARAEQVRAITDVRASTLAGRGQNQDATLTMEQRAKTEARQKCSQSCQERFRNNAAMLGECIANCI